MHKHLERQIARASIGGALDQPALFAAISDYYAAQDRERALRDRSLGLMSEELLALNQRIRDQGEARFQSVFDQAADALLVADGNDRISRCNQAAALLTGCPADRLLGKPVTHFLPEGGRDGECELSRADGERLPVEIRCTPLLLDDARSTLYSLRDISERQRSERERAAFTERLARSNNELERFAYIASHDLQEPLRSIISFTGLLERRLAPLLDKDTRDYLRFVLEGSTRMRSMVRALLELSRLDGAKPDLAPLSLNGLLAEVLQELTAALDSSGAAISVAALPPVQADAEQIKRVLLNLLGNALKFRGEAAPQIDVFAQRAGPQWQITVRDHGIGIAPEHHIDVFQVFRRLHTAEEYPGTGMGLAICQRIVQAHGGRIWVDSPPDGGTAFHFTLCPVASAAAPAAEGSAATTHLVMPAGLPA